MGLLPITASQGDDSPGQRARTSPATQGPGYPPAKALHRPVRLGTSPRKAPAALPGKPSLLGFLAEPGDPVCPQGHIVCGFQHKGRDAGEVLAGACESEGLPRPRRSSDKAAGSLASWR